MLVPRQADSYMVSFISFIGYVMVLLSGFWCCVANYTTAKTKTEIATNRQQSLILVANFVPFQVQSV